MLIGLETSLHFSYQISLAFQHCDSMVWRTITCESNWWMAEDWKTHMEWNFLCLVLALLPERMLAVVSHHFVLKELRMKIIFRRKWSSDPLASGVVCLPLFHADGLRHIVADWESSGKRKVELHFFTRFLLQRRLSLVMIENLWSQLALPRFKGFLVMLCNTKALKEVDQNWWNRSWQGYPPPSSQRSNCKH